MGALSSKGKDSDSNQMRFVMQGLHNAGKTSLLYRLKHGEEMEYPIPTVGIDAEIFEHDGLNMMGMDATGRCSNREMFRLYSWYGDAFIYMIDSADASRFDESLDELNDTILLNENTKNLVVLVVANKQDLENAVGPEEIQRKIKKQCKIHKRISLFVMPCSVVTGEGIQEAFDLFVKLIKMKSEGKLRNGLVPNALEVVREEEEKKDANIDGDHSKMFEKKKKSVFKDPVHLLKKVLFH